MPPALVHEPPVDVVEDYPDVVSQETAAVDEEKAKATMKDGVLELTWEVFGELCRVLAVKVATDGYEPELVIGIAKAGVIPGAVIAVAVADGRYAAPAYSAS